MPLGLPRSFVEKRQLLGRNAGEIGIHGAPHFLGDLGAVRLGLRLETALLLPLEIHLRQLHGGHPVVVQGIYIVYIKHVAGSGGPCIDALSPWRPSVNFAASSPASARWTNRARPTRHRRRSRASSSASPAASPRTRQPSSCAYSSRMAFASTSCSRRPARSS